MMKFPGLISLEKPSAGKELVLHSKNTGNCIQTVSTHNLQVQEDYGWDASATAWVQFVNNGDPSRDWLLDPVMLEACGEVKEKSVLDVGCGEGRFCRMLAKRGAVVVGVDPTEELIISASNRDPIGTYQVANAESLPFGSNDFDLVISYLVLIDIPDFRKGISEMARVLKPGGILVVANLNPFITAVNPPWIRDSRGKKLHVALDEYNSERGDEVAWSGIEIVNFHRPLNAYMKAFLEQRLVLEMFDEPVPTKQALAAVPSLADAKRVPYFHVMRWRKPIP